MASDFAENLRLLCSYKASISQVCRDLSINRSQFNRYLAGNSAPRPGLLRKLCDYFGVEPHEILAPPEDFARLIQVRGVPTAAAGHWLEAPLQPILGASQGRLRELQGLFFEYYHSMSTPGSILRALTAFEEHNGTMTYRRLERIGPAGRACRRHFRYQGVALMLGDRIFLTDYEYGLKVELTQTVLYPDYARRANTLLGVRVGVAAHRQRTPCCARVYLERAPTGSWRRHLRDCGLFPANSNEIPAAIRLAIDNNESGPHHFLAHMAG